MNTDNDPLNRGAAQAVLEEVLWHALEAAANLRAHRHPTEEERGALMAYLNTLEFGVQQAASRGLSFADPELQGFDPETFLASESED